MIIDLQGYTLGERQRHYNELVKEAIKNNEEIKAVDYTENDVENLKKIDIACHRRDIDYVLEVLQGEDTLYVSRALKQSSWLITEDKYAHIINPQYLHEVLFPNMLSKAANKFLLQIRLKIKDEKRAEEFYNYIHSKNPKSAHKWLPCCSITFIESVVKSCHEDLSLVIFKRICRKSLSVLKAYLEACTDSNKKNAMTMNLLSKNNVDQYLDVIESLPSDRRHRFNSSATELIMIKCPERIFQQFEIYADILDCNICGKYVKNAEDFLSKHKHNNQTAYLKSILSHVSSENIYDLLKKISDFDDSSVEPIERFFTLFNHIGNKWSYTISKMYTWYEFAPFDIAYIDIKRLVQAECSPEGRHALLDVLLKCARRNSEENVQTVLKYYHEKHINEPIKYNMKFVLSLYDHTRPHRFGEVNWQILNELFHKMEVYIESSNKVQLCVEIIIMYKLLHGEEIPKVIENKFKFNNLLHYQKDLNLKEREIVANYIITYLIQKLDGSVTKEVDFDEKVTNMERLLYFVQVWNIESISKTYYNLIIDKVVDLVNLRKCNSWSRDMSNLYSILKFFKFDMFESSIIMKPCEDIFIAILKRDPDLLGRYHQEVEDISRNDAISLKRFLNKLRVFWPQSLALQWIGKYFQYSRKTTGHKSLVRGLFVLFQQKPLLGFIQEYAPKETKIKWGTVDGIHLSLQQYIAKNMHFARPLLPSNIVLLYAKGDYLQFTLHSFNAIFYNMKRTKIVSHMTLWLNAPASLQKHGIRLAYAKLSPKDMLPLFSSIWISSKNCTIRAEIFCATHNIFRSEKDEVVIKQVWNLLRSFIKDLNFQDTMIYSKLIDIYYIPKCILSEYFCESYTFLKSVPEKAGCDSLLEFMTIESRDLMEFHKPDFVTNVLLGSVFEIFVNNEITYLQIIAAYLLCSEDEDTQMKKYNEVLAPILKRCAPEWVTNKGSKTKTSFISFVNNLFYYFKMYVVDKKKVLPVMMFTAINKELEENHLKRRDYVLLTNWKLTVIYVKALAKGDYLTMNGFDGNLIDISLNYLSRKIILYLRRDTKKYFPSIYILFAKSLYRLFDNINCFDNLLMLKVLDRILQNENDSKLYLLVMELLPQEGHCYRDAKVILKKIMQKIHSNQSLEIRMHLERFGETSFSSENNQTVSNTDTLKSFDNAIDDGSRVNSESELSMSDDTDGSDKEIEESASISHSFLNGRCSLL